MAIAHTGKRRITVDGAAFYWRGGEYAWPVTAVAEDKSFMLEWRRTERDPATVLLRGTHPALPARGAEFRRYYLPPRLELEPYAIVTPGAVAAIVRWALDPREEKRPVEIAAAEPTEANDRWRDEAARFLRPARPRANDVRRVLKQVLGRLPDDPVAALASFGGPAAQRDAVGSVWEALAARGHLPPAWVEGRGPRVLTHHELAGVPVALPLDDPRDAWVECAVPATLVALRCLAEDPEGVIRAEALTREFLSRITPWERTHTPSKNARAVDAPIRWHCLEHEDGPSWVWHEAPSPLELPDDGELALGNTAAATGYESVAIAMMQFGRFYEHEYRARFGLPDSPLSRGLHHAHMLADGWRAACEQGARLTRPGLIAPSVDDVLYRELRDPSEPLVELYRLGYALHTIDERGATLCAVLAPRDSA